MNCLPWWLILLVLPLGIAVALMLAFAIYFFLLLRGGMQ